ncbi:hydroxyethylthiazole kinase [Pullulanibacillus pueri]|uniref:Hydroxyethylthiazole kinase n=1 Tax=Pullulanibacillus pueri TaxID=1437324 RepID=A0A8J2ZVN9_9BACL|nr:hydroxyethylthiazole kinase [Pullulanibacillus pueri]MBM7682401.1 hydroxyethylthiazole kinase [Pullulanibacillus pueri]GGH81781.1 hydroxyethylthiazole kinase [Pullulanibacillus pueri]
MTIYEAIHHLIEDIKASRPLIHHITNAVTINDCANVTLAVGASPVMADDPQDAEEMTAHAEALVINMGTLSERTVQAMLVSGKVANKKGIPVIFDPVGVGATSYRMEVAKILLHSIRFSVIRGNSSEIRALAGIESNGRGVDAGDSMEDVATIAKHLAEQHACIVAVTGQKDVITDGRQLAEITGGHPMLAQVSGTGCMTNSLIASACAVTKDHMSATITGIALMNRAGELGYARLQQNEGTGMFRVRLIDALSLMTKEALQEGGTILVR